MHAHATRFDLVIFVFICWGPSLSCLSCVLFVLCAFLYYSGKRAPLVYRFVGAHSIQEVSPAS